VVQVEHTAASTGDVRPCGQTEHAAASLPGWKYPSVHSVQPLPSTCCPARHNEQDTAPAPLDRPLAQFKQVVCFETFV
jgi:hypothetical protein